MICPGPIRLCPAQNDQKGVRVTTAKSGNLAVWVFCRRPRGGCLITIVYTGFVQLGLPRSSPKNAAAPLYEQIPDMTSDALANCDCATHTTNHFETCPLQTTPPFQANVWSDIARSLPHFSHDCWTPTDPSALTPDDSLALHIAQQYECICGKNFPTIQRDVQVYS